MNYPDIHIIPMNDLIPHTQTQTCFCIPVIEERNKTFIVIHNSYDNREAKEKES